MLTFNRAGSAIASALALVAFTACSQSTTTSTTTASDATTAAPSSAAMSSKHVRGTIATVSPTSMTVTTSGGPVVLGLSKTSGVAGVVRGTAADIKPGTFVGIANVPGSGAMRALEVVVFPNSMRGTGEGNYPWDLPANGHASMMTNGTVSSSGSKSMMTNGTVSHAAAPGQPITLTYKGGSQRVVVPPNVPIVRVVPGSAKLLAPGVHVFVITTSPSGKLTAAHIIAGENGVVPPM
ncbi:MAG TPA: hypothetical protein VIG32_00805 [Candidatus Baltobacteraceae bacterium]